MPPKQEQPLESAQERLTGIKKETRDKLAAAKAGIEAKKAEYERGSTFNMTAFEENLRASGANDNEIKWARQKIWEALPDSAKDPSKTPEAIALTKKAQDALKTGLPKVTATEEKAKGWIESLKQRFSGFAGIFPMIGAYFASMAAAQTKEGKTSFMTGLYEKIAGWFGHESPSVKFEKFRSEVKLPDGFAFGDTSDTEATINKADGEKVGTLKFNAENGRATLVTGLGTFSYKDAAELNKNINDKLKAAPAQAPAKPEEAQETDESKYTKLFQTKGWTLEKSKLTDDLKTLKDSGITDIDKLINEAAAQDSNLNKILEAIKTTLPKDQVFNVRLADLLFQKMKKEDFNTVLAVIKNEKTEYTLEKIPAKIREFVDKANSAKDSTAIASVITSYKK